MKFSANISTLFSDLPSLLDRYRRVLGFVAAKLILTNLFYSNCLDSNTFFAKMNLFYHSPNTSLTAITSNSQYFQKLFRTKFTAIECQSPYQHPLNEWQETFETARKQGKILPKFDLINSIPVFSVFKDRVPSIAEFDQQILESTLKYAKFLQVKKVHLVLTDSHRAEDL